jgi:hypothetical protein
VNLGPIRVEPAIYAAASELFGQDVAGQLSVAALNLQDALRSTEAMAGSDPGGTKWAVSYDQAAAVTLGAMTDLTGASYQLAAMLEQTGFNHGMAESASDPTRSAPTPADRTRYSAFTTSTYRSPSASGGSVSAPYGWDLIAHLVGYVWPNGHQDKLRGAAAAWSAAGQSLEFATLDIDQAVEAVLSQQSPEVQDAAAICDGMKLHIADVAASCRALSMGCSDFAGYLDKAHTDVSHELVNLLEWTAGIETGGAIFGVLTAGFAELPAQGVEASRIAATAARVGNIIAHLIDMAGAVAETISGVITRVAEVCQRLKAIIGARLSVATARVVARLPALADDTGAIAFGRLSAWSKGWSARGFEIEVKLGGNLPRSFPTIDRFNDGVVTSIKSIDLTSATYQNSATLTSKLRAYVDKVSQFSGRSFDGVRVRSGDITSRQLNVAVQPGVASPAQQAILDQLAQYAKSKNVILIVSEVP